MGLLFTIAFTVAFSSNHSPKSAPVLSKINMEKIIANASTTRAPHDSNCYTQGLFFLNNTHLFESCGGYSGKIGPSYFRIL